MTNANNLFGVIIGLNLVFAGLVVTFLVNSPKGLSAGKVEALSDRRNRQFMGFCLLAAGTVYSLASLARLL